MEIGSDMLERHRFEGSGPGTTWVRLRTIETWVRAT
jgi:hypothetical protein